LIGKNHGIKVKLKLPYFSTDVKYAADDAGFGCPMMARKYNL